MYLHRRSVDSDLYFSVPHFENMILRFTSDALRSGLRVTNADIVCGVFPFQRINVSTGASKKNVPFYRVYYAVRFVRVYE
jgi:hypothetical protein